MRFLRGYKSVHNPLKGQELAVNLVQYGQAVGIPLLVAASIGMVGGFALLNLGLYQTIGRSWYLVKDGQADPTYVDFLANALIVLLKIVDVLDFARASHVLDVAYVRQIKWPSTTLLAAFRMFFTLVLLQQVFASVRRGQVLSETITDLWNPNEPIHERACSALPQHGPGAVDAAVDFTRANPLGDEGAARTTASDAGSHWTRSGTVPCPSSSSCQ